MRRRKSIIERGTADISPVAPVPRTLPISPEGDTGTPDGDTAKRSGGLSDEGLMEVDEAVRLAEDPMSAQLVDISRNCGIGDASQHDDPAGP
ncbi:MAG: hypothetical protein IIB28_07780 [Chloroflexi bacterium]|nr:hypothetical protein [Chloroflexota bacterium]